MPSPDLSTEPEHAETAVAPTGRRWDPWVAVVGLVALVVYVAQGYGGILERDVAIYVYSAQQVLDGVPPYLGILNRAGPLAHLLPALGVGLGRLAGFDDLVGARILFTVFSAGCVSAVYLLGRDLFASRRAGIAAAATLLCFSGFIAYATFGPREKTPMVLFLTLALWVMTRRRWFSVGVFLSLATLILQIAFFVGAPALLLGLLLGSPRRDWLRNAGRLAVGGLVPLALHVVYFAAVGALREFVDAFWTINAQYTTPTPFTRNVDKSWASLDAGFGLSLYVAIFGLVALVALTVAAWVRRSGQPPGRLANLTALSAGAVGGAIWTMRDFDSWRDTFLLLPLSESAWPESSTSPPAGSRSGRRWRSRSSGASRPPPTPSTTRSPRARTPSGSSGPASRVCWQHCPTTPRSCRSTRPSPSSSPASATRPGTRCSRAASRPTSTTPGRAGSAGSSAAWCARSRT